MKKGINNKSVNTERIYNYNKSSNLIFGTSNPTAIKKIYNKVFDMDLNEKIIELERIRMELEKEETNTKRIKENKKEVMKLCVEKIHTILKHRKGYAKYFNTLSYYNYLNNKKIEHRDKMFYNTYYLNIFSPYSVVGSKSNEWFNKFYDFISELPSIYLNLKGFSNSGTELFRFMEETEYKDLLSNSMNSNPSWSSNEDIYAKFLLNPLYNGKPYALVGTSFKFNDILFDTRFEERIKGNYEKGKGEAESFIKKGATPIYSPIPIFTTTFDDCKSLYPFIEDDYRLDGSETLNGYETTDTILSSHNEDDIRKYGTLTTSKSGEKHFLLHNPTPNLELSVRVNKGKWDYIKTKIDMYMNIIEHSLSNTSYTNNLIKSVNILDNRLKTLEVRIKDNMKTIELFNKGDYKFEYYEATSEGYEGEYFPTFYFPETKTIISGGVKVDIKKPKPNYEEMKLVS